MDRVRAETKGGSIIDPPFNPANKMVVFSTQLIGLQLLLDS